MKPHLLGSVAALLSLATVAACATSASSYVDTAGADGGAGDGSQPTATESDDPADQPPHALGTVVLGETHGVGASTKSVPVVSATFLPDAMLGRACATKLDGCEIQKMAKCTKVTSSVNGCSTNEACVFDRTSCAPTCKAVPICSTACAADEVCSAPLPGVAGSCVKRETFDAGPLAFSGTTTSITLFPPYAFESTGQGAPFLGGASLEVQATGATQAGFEKFDEKFTATTFLQTSPSLSKLTKAAVFGAGPLPISWVPANDTIVITLSGAGGSATCKVGDALGTFAVPRSVVKAAQGDGATTTGSSLTISVARQKKDVKKDKKTKGTLALSPVQPDGWLELITRSSETASFQGCQSTQTVCGDVCTNLDTDPANCGGCGNACTGAQTCSARSCTGGTSSCATCRSSAQGTSGSCASYYTTCSGTNDCYYLASCAASCTSASCVTTCEASYPNGKTAYAPLKSCLSSYCSGSCGF